MKDNTLPQCNTLAFLLILVGYTSLYKLYYHSSLLQGERQACFAAHYAAQQGKPANFTSTAMMVAFTYIERDKVITQCATLERVCVCSATKSSSSTAGIKLSLCNALDVTPWTILLDVAPFPLAKSAVLDVGVTTHQTCMTMNAMATTKARKAKCDCSFQRLLCRQKGHYTVKM